MHERRSFLSWLVRLPGAVLLGGAVAGGATACAAAWGDRARDVSQDGDAGTTDTAPDAPGDGRATDATDAAPGDGQATDTATEDAAPDAAPSEVADDGSTAACEPTGGDIQGPFYEPDAPSSSSLVPAGEPGVRLAVAGVVYGPDCKTPLPGAVVEIWQVDDAGAYHDDKLRGTLAAGADGGYAFDSIRPGSYVQASGPRPAHIHYRVSAPGHRTLVTQLYFEGDPYLAPNDSCGVCGSDDEGRIIPLAEGRGGALSGTFDVVLAAS